MEEARFGRHFVCLTALFILGESVIGLPYNNSGGYSVLAFIAAAALGLLVLAAGFLLLKFACRFKAAAAFLYLASVAPWRIKCILIVFIKNSPKALLLYC